MDGFIITVTFLLLALAISHFSNKRAKKRNASGYYFTTEGVVAGDELKSEFSKLVIAIAYYNLTQKNEKCSGAHFDGVEEDMKDAFLQAVEEVYLVNKNNSHSGTGAVLDRMKQLTEKYSERKSTPELIRELREKGLPPKVMKELEKSKGILPTIKCIRPHEIGHLSDGKKLTEDRMKHFSKCKFCKPLVARIIRKRA